MKYKDVCKALQVKDKPVILKIIWQFVSVVTGVFRKKLLYCVSEGYIRKCVMCTVCKLWISCDNYAWTKRFWVTTVCTLVYRSVSSLCDNGVIFKGV